MLLIIFSCILSLLIYFAILRPNRYWEKKGVPYVKPVPIFGNMFRNFIQQRNFSELTHELYAAHPNERYTGFFQFLNPTLLIRDLELIKKITVKEFDSFPDHRGFAVDTADQLANKNLFNLTSANGWHDMRTTLSPAFTSSKMRAMFVLMEQCAEQFVEYFQNQKGLIRLEMKDTFTRFTNDVIGTTAFGVTCNSLANKENEFYVMGRKLTNFTTLQNIIFFGYILFPKLMKFFGFHIFTKVVTDFYRDLIKQTLQIRKEQKIVRPDVVHLLMEAKEGCLKHDNENSVVDTGFAVVEESDLGKSQKRQKMKITDEDITAQSIIFFFAGFDTVSTLMCYICYELARNPDVQETLQREIDENCQGKITYEAVLGLKYLDCVVSETLRKWPPAAFGDRLSVKPFTIEAEKPGERNVHLEAGTCIWIPIECIHNDPNYYPNPEKFDPERFNDENKRNIKPFSYLPFGAGPRNCIGSRFALLETKLIILKIVQKFEIVPTDKTPDRIIFSKKGFIPLPDDGIWLGFKARSTTN